VCKKDVGFSANVELKIISNEKKSGDKNSVQSITYKYMKKRENYIRQLTKKYFFRNIFEKNTLNLKIIVFFIIFMIFNMI